MKLSRAVLVLCSVATMAVIPQTAFAAPPQRGGIVRPANITAEGQQYAETILAKVNALRVSKGLQPVTRFVELDSVSQDWSEQMAASRKMEHRPDFIKSYPAGYQSGSENIAWRSGGGDVGAGFYEQWLNSPGHYANMVDPAANAIGIGVAQDPVSGTWYGTQNFAQYPDTSKLTVSGGAPTPTTPAQKPQQPPTQTTTAPAQETTTAAPPTSEPSVALPETTTAAIETPESTAADAPASATQPTTAPDGGGSVLSSSQQDTSTPEASPSATARLVNSSPWKKGGFLAGGFIFVVGGALFVIGLLRP